MLNDLTIKDFFKNKIPVGTILANLGKGTSKIEVYSSDGIKYKRGNSTITLKFNSIYDVWSNFENQDVSSIDLRKFAPRVFDSSKSGHSCNCTFLFMILKESGVINEIKGNGVAGSPYYIHLPSFQEAAD